jgi:phosphohistidine phosphatase SixA
MMRGRARGNCTLWLGALLTTVWAAAGQAQVNTTLSGPALVAALRAGGHVIVMRHASSPRQPPESPNADNVTRERQLDETGRTSATAMGEALRRLKVPVGDVLTSPTYRARETVRFAQLQGARSFEELGDGGQSMQGAAEKQGAWLQQKVSSLPRGTNTILVTHMPNIARAFPDLADVADGESLVFGSDGKGGSRLVARVRIDEWPKLR